MFFLMILQNNVCLVECVFSQVHASAALLPAKRKNSHVVAAASTISATASSKRQKQDLTCTVCGITVTGEKGMQDHLKEKAHMRKAAALAQPSQEEAAEEEGACTPKRFYLGANSGNSYEVVQMNGFVLCEVCDVKTADLAAMVRHLNESNHISKAKQPKELPEAVVNGVRRVDGDVQETSKIKHTSKQKAAIDASAGGKSVLAQSKTDKVVDVRTTVTPGQQAKKADATATVRDSNKSMVLDAGGVQHVVEKVDGFLLCPSCKVTAHSESVMRSHLAGKKHKDKGAGGKRTVVAQATSKEATFTGHSQGQDDESVVKSAVDGRGSFSVEIDEHVDAGDRTEKAEEEEEKLQPQPYGRRGLIMSVHLLH
jgi:hypothetical protein